MIDLIDIVRSWAAAANPTEEQLETARGRLSICRSCEHRIETPERCGLCGCPLKGKVFSNNGCPDNRW
jgi:hypothetical protein